MLLRPSASFIKVFETMFWRFYWSSVFGHLLSGQSFGYQVQR
jgi:hypothetical protein